jgi:superfamily II DNA/RNA helicase
MAEGRIMNFGKNSNVLQRYERAKAKLNEFSVSEAERNVNKLGQTSSNDLLYSTIRVLSQFAEAYCDGHDTTELYKDLTFVAHFYENYAEGDGTNDDYFFLLIGAVANVLSDNFGNAKSLIVKIDRQKDFNPIACLVFEYISYGLGVVNESTFLQENIYKDYYCPLIAEIQQSDAENFLPTLRKLADNLLKKNDHEAAYFGHVLCAVQKKFIENSAVRNIPQFSNSQVADWSKYFNQRGSLRILWQAQKLLLDNDVLKGKNATIQLPTGVGKTRSIELIISAAFLLRGVSLAIVVAPLRALCNEIEKDLQRSLKGIVEITALSDIFDDEEFDFEQQQVIVLTPEKLSFLMRHNSDIIQKSGLIIFDEAHMFDDQSRGATYELLILRVKEYLSDTAQKVFISAVMPNAEDLNEWLTGTGEIVADKDIKRTEKSVGFYSQGKNIISFFQQIDLIEKSDEMVYIPQVCPRKPDIVELNKRGKNVDKPKYIFPDLSKGTDVALYLACKICSRDNCAAIYVNKPSRIFSLAKNIIKLKDKGYALFDNVANNSTSEANFKIYELAKQHFGDDNEFVKIMSIGFFPHFGDLENGLRVSIEHEIRKRNIVCVICTSTLAEGVNLPIRYLFLTSLKDAFGQPLSTRKFQNLIGRTARSGIHTEGSLICTAHEYIDEKTSNSTQWEQVINLFDASKSEHCNSAILQIFNNCKIPYTTIALVGSWLIGEFVKSYESGTPININALAENLFENNVSDYVKKSAERKRIDIRKIISDAIQARIFQIASIVETLETVIFEESFTQKTDAVEVDGVISEMSLAEKTLAYKMASDEQKSLIINLFDTIAKKVATVPEEKRAVFAKTMNGIDTLNSVDVYLQANIGLYNSCIFSEGAWLKVIIDLSWHYVATNSKFSKLTDDKKQQLIEAWLQGKTYKEIIDISGLDIDEVIKVCQKDMGYSFNLLLSCVVEILTQYKPTSKSDAEWETFIGKLTLFQQRVKYGLLNAAEVAAYEIGFADRVIARKIGAMILNKYSEQTIEEYKLKIIDSKDEVTQMLNPYPSYFKTIII